MERAASLNESIVDSLDPRRRFESAYPKLNEKLRVWHSADAAELASRLLTMADRLLREVLPDSPQQAMAKLRRQIEMHPKNSSLFPLDLERALSCIVQHGG